MAVFEAYLAQLTSPQYEEQSPLPGDGDRAEAPPPNEEAPRSKTAAEKERKRRQKAAIAVQHVDLIKDEFWNRRPWILSGRAGRLKK